MMLVFIAGPGRSASQVRKAILMAEELWNDGIASIVPQNLFLEELVSPRPAKEWLEQYNEHLRRCDVLLRLDGESKVADRQVALAKDLCIPVFENYKELLKFIREGLDGTG